MTQGDLLLGDDGLPLPLLPPPSQAFLEELRERVRRRGWARGDLTDILRFVRDLYEEAGLPPGKLEAYEEAS